MAESSSGMWRCKNPTCAHHIKPTIPLFIGIEFNTCPNCQTKNSGEPEASAGDQTPQQVQGTSPMPPVLTQSTEEELVKGTSNLDLSTAGDNKSKNSSGVETPASPQAQAGNEPESKPTVVDPNPVISPPAEGSEHKGTIESAVDPARSTTTQPKEEASKDTATTKETADSDGNSNESDPTKIEVPKVQTPDSATTGDKNSTGNPQANGNPKSNKNSKQTTKKKSSKTTEKPEAKKASAKKDHDKKGTEGKAKDSVPRTVSKQPKTEKPPQQPQPANEMQGPLCQYCKKAKLSPYERMCGECNAMNTELGPPCQFCQKILLSKIARVCEYCKKPQRKDPTGGQESKYSKVFGVHADAGSSEFKNPNTVLGTEAAGKTYSQAVTIGDRVKQNPRKRTSSLSDVGDVSSASKQVKRDDGYSSDSESSKSTTSQQQLSHGHQERGYMKPDKPAELLPAKNGAQKGKKQQQSNISKGKASASGPNNKPDVPIDPSKLQGLTSDIKQSVLVVFHIIIPKPHWEWTHDSKVYLRFGCEALGSWHSVGCFEQRHINERLCEMTCKLRIRSDVLNKAIPYKYFVCTPKSMAKKSSFEFLHDIPSHKGQYLNRYLQISSEKLKSLANGGTYDQYDTMAFPEHLKVAVTGFTGTLTAGFNKFKSLLGFSNPKQELQVLSNTDMRLQCFVIYLERYKNVLLSGFSQEISPKALVEGVNSIFKSLLITNVTYKKNQDHWKETLDSIPNDPTPMRKMLLEWLQPCVEHLSSLPTEKQLLHSACIAWSLVKVELPIYMMEGLSPLLGHLCAQQPTEDHQQWEEYNYLCHFVLEPYRKELAQAIQRFSVSNKQSSTGRLFAVPLYNFLTKHSEPYDNLFTKDYENLLKVWNHLSQTFQLEEVRSTVTKSRYVEDYFSEWKDICELDPLMLLVFVYICPDTELGHLLEQIPPHVSTAWLSFKITNSRLEVSRRNVDTVLSWLSTIDKTLTQQFFNSVYINPIVMIESAAAFFRRCTVFLTEASDHYLAVINASLSLVFKVLGLYIECKGEKSLIDLEDAFSNIVLYLGKWMHGYLVVGTTLVFGCETWGTGRHTCYNSNCKGEVRIWKSLLSVKCSNEKIAERWHQSVRDVVSERVNKVPEELVVRVLKQIEGSDQRHGLLISVFMNRALNAVENLLLKSHGSASENLKKITSEDSKSLGEILGSILKKKYPQLKEEDSKHDWITLDVLLEWDLWPNYVKIVQQVGGLLKTGLHHECQVACICASTKFEQICTELQKGDISLYDLEKMKQREVRLRRLCEVVTGKGDQKLSHEQVIASLDQRLVEFDKFSSRLQAYLEVCRWMSDSKCLGIEQLRVELERDYRGWKIRDLCTVEGGTLQLLCLDQAKPLDPFVDHFDKLQSDLFLRPLNVKKTQVSSKQDLTIADIYPLIWNPVFEDCQQLLNNVASLQVKLSLVDRRLKPYEKNLMPELMNLAVGIHKCSQPAPDSIKEAVSKIKDYWRICEYREGAQVFLDLRDVLNLTGGDFSVIEKFAKDLQMSMKDETLASIDNNLVKAGQFLEEIINTPQRKECLQVFVKSQDIVQWLKKATKSVSEIQGFVTVALATAAGGEGDFASDRLSHLRTVGSGFAALIYDVPATLNYVQLMQRCQSLWDSLAKNPTLPRLLRDCNADVPWYQSVKDTQGSVETTSYGQMTNILKYGTYRVGFNKSAQTVHDLISVSLTQRFEKLLKTKYSLDELRDLESKLVLICGNKADTRAEVDHYLNLLHSATRIAELYLDLQRAGDLTYSTVHIEFKCAMYEDRQFNEALAKKKISALQDYTRALDTQLVTWRKSVDSAREKYYELNYFTTLQLLKLRKELGRLTRPGASNAVSPSVLVLLKSVSPDVSSRVVIDSLQARALAEPTASADETTTIDQNVMDSEAPALMDIHVHESPPAPQRPSSTSLSASPTVKPLLEPALTFEELDDKQQGIVIQCESMGYSRAHVLRAFVQCDKDANLFDLEEWCENNEDQLANEGNTLYARESTVPVNESFTYDPDQQEDMDTSALSVSNADTSVEQDHTVSTPTHQIKTVVRQAMDETHPGVQELVEAGYDLQATIEAMEQCGGDVHQAMNVLDDREREDEGQQTGGYVRSISREEQAGAEVYNEEVETADIVQVQSEEKDKSHLELDQLGRVLQAISAQVPGAVTTPRSFDTGFLKAGLPNLLVTPSDEVLRTVLALYTSDADLPLPTQEEVLLCTDKTTTEEVSLLWRRAIGDPGCKRVFCLAHADKLSYQVCDGALRSLAELTQGKNDYRLTVICSKEDEEKSHIISRLHTYRRPIVPQLTEGQCRSYLRGHFVSSTDMEVTGQVMNGVQLPASVVDPDNSCVRVVSSTRSGMGKSLYIKRRAQQLREATSNYDIHVTIPVHGPLVTADTLLDSLVKHIGRDPCTIYHLDIAPRVLREVDCLLFSLLILNGLTDSRGNVWKSHTSHLYTVEVTLPENGGGAGFQTLNLLTLLPTVTCASPRDVEQQRLGDGMLGMDDEEFSGPTIQRVYQYLRRHAGGHNLDTFSYHHGTKEGNERDFLKIILSKCGIRDPSWAEIHHFTKFLDIQLNSCENSVFCDEMLVGDVMSGLKGFVVKFMIRMSQDFSTPSLEGVLARENLEEMPAAAEQGEDDQLEQYQIVRRRQWEQNSHPYIFFNDDTVSITFVGFMVTQNGDLMDPANRAIIEPSIMRPQLYTGLKQNRVNFDEDYRAWNKKTMIEKIATVMGIQFVYDPDGTYVLTTDNLIKMLAIQMRFRCDIPVVIMGETGCGKTRLIRYMCDLARHGREIRNMLILKIHGGITDQDVTKFVEDAEKEAAKNKTTDPNLYTVVFFDEANTTESIGLIKEIMCDRRINGRPVSKDLKFIAACNPYRKHSEKMIEKLETAGLGFYVRDTQQKLGKIPLRQLVYRVLDLPPSMRPLVYDFGQLNTGTEFDYTRQIVQDHVTKHPELSTESPAAIPAIAKVLAASQKFMRDQKNECSFVSLRDVERAMIVFEYFYEKMDDVFAPLMNKRAQAEYNERYAVDSDSEDEDAVLPPPPLHPNKLTRALILSLSVCYHARLQHREPYEEQISARFANPLGLPGGAQQFRDQIKWCQEGLLGEMVLGPNIARNTALRENVFMMAVCIELRIPLFLVGKPGSSKSLAKSIIQDSMHGQGAQSPVLREFKQVHMFSYQCSQLSTPESVIEVFKSAERFQAKQDIKQYVSVVVLDEVGLAEDSPSLPLKALHPLLEDGTEGSGKDHQQKTVEREKRVAFIGISNWALDPAKMNRGVMVTRGDPGLKDLQLSAKGICSNKDQDPVKRQLQKYFEPLSKAYTEICKQCEEQKRQFFGLRDFYSLIKMLYWMCERSRGNPLSSLQMQHAIMRNFGGLESDSLNPLELFQKEIGYNDNSQDYSHLDEEMRSIMAPDCSRLGLIKTSLNTKDTTWHGENRYLLFLTENYAALDILKHYLNVGSESSEEVDDLTSQPYILFGSSFPKDREYTQVCRNINQIKICMETGRTVILLNLENLYESLYDVLNQYYMYYGGVRYVDLGLQTHRVKCRVHDNFKLILIAEKDTVYKKFPTPLINRLEKHFVLTSSVLEDWQHEVLGTFEKWIHDFSHTSDMRGDKFVEAHAFIGYQKDTPAAVVFQATNQLNGLKQGSQESERLQRAGVLSEELFNGTLTEDEEWNSTVLRLSQFLLLQTAADDALVRLKRSQILEEDIKYFHSLYYKHQHHGCITEFLHYECREDHEMFMQVTTHSPLMTPEELGTIAASVSMKFAQFDLHEFDTELDFSNKIGPKFLREESDPRPFLVVIQCDSGHLNSDLIACARYRVCDEAIKAKTKNRIRGRSDITHILFVIRLPQQEVKSQFVGFQGDPWISVHIDDLRPTSEATVIPEQALSASISELFIGRLEPKKPAEVLTALQEHPEHKEQPEPQLEATSLSEEQNEWPQTPEYEHISSDTNSEMSEDMSTSSGDEEDSLSVQLPNVADMEMDEQLFERVCRDTTQPPAVKEESSVMEVEDIEEEGADDYKTVPLPPVEGMQTEEDPSLSHEQASPSLLEPELPSVDVQLIPPQPADDLPNPLQFSQVPPDSLQQEFPQVSPTELTEPIPQVHSIQPQAVKAPVDEPSIEPEEQSSSFHAQHRRLLGCVQAAVSMLKDTQQDRAVYRIQKLMYLIPKKPPTTIDDSPFYGLLVRFIHMALRQREAKQTEYQKDWVLTEAMSGRRLQNGGTFRNVLARRIDEVITPFFAEIIAHIDQNCNFNLFDPRDQTSSLSQFWLAMFKLTGSKINFTSLSEGKTSIKTDFICKLPFSWFIKEVVDAQRASDQGTQRGINDHLTSTVEALRQTELGELLKDTKEDNVQQFYELYLHDFVRYVHKSSHKANLADIEYKLIEEALDALTHNPDLCSVDGHESLSRQIVALHLVYSQCSSQVLQYGQLVLHRPSILQSLLNVDRQTRAGLEEFSLHLYAVERVLESDQDDDPTSQTLAGLNPPLQHKEQTKVTKNIPHWLNHVRLSQSVIDSILRSNAGNEVAIKARRTWQRIRALQIFAEKVYLNHSGVEGLHFIMKRMNLKLSRHSDFLKKDTLVVVKQQLNTMITGPTLKTDPDTKKKMQNNCDRFFMEVVSSLCFGGREAPEPGLVKVLLDTVLEGQQTRKLSPYDRPDDRPTIRSFLLQLLLEHEPEHVRDYLGDYFERSVVAVGEHSNQALCLLYIQCSEDAQRKRVNGLSPDSQTRELVDVLENGYRALQEHSRAGSQMSLEYLESVAAVRLGLSFIAEQLKDNHPDHGLLRVVKDLCTDGRVNELDPADTANMTGPVLYLLRLLVRQHSCLDKVNETHDWVVPEQLRRGQDDEQIIDPFVLYDDYMGAKGVRSAVTAAMFTATTDELLQCVQAGAEPSRVAFALYQKATLSYRHTEPAKRIQDKALEVLNGYIQSLTSPSPDMRHMLRLLLANQQGGPLAQLIVAPHQPLQCRRLSPVVIHSVAALLSRASVDLILPFVNMLNNPSALENAYLPTMAEDMLQEVRQAGGTFYECPNGHPYLVGECGRPVEEKVCRECGATIGGRSHALRTDNRSARTNDTTKTGYDLGAPDRRSMNPERERSLSAPAVCIVRALMHSAFIWTSCTSNQDSVDLAKLTKGQVRPQDLPEFFWRHLEKDWECLSRSTGRGAEECAMIIHLVLQRVLTTTPPQSPVVANVKHLQSKDARREWERLFNDHYINPVLSHMDTLIEQALDKVAKDDDQGHDQLFYLAFEKVTVDESKLESHLWTFRKQITLDHLKNELQAGTPCKILEAFLQTEPSLRATQYLPDIVRLQQFMFDTFDRRLDKSRAEQLTIREFLKEVRNTRNENTKNEVQEMIDSLRKAWALVGQKLRNHNRLAVEDQYMLAEFNRDTPLVYLIPTTMREGRCTTALVDYLVLTHNDFIEKCRLTVSGSNQSVSAVWREHKVPITHIHRCHLLEYEHQLQSIILSHCRYSLTVGKGTDIKHDFPALEKQILNQFIYGKPTILLDIPNVAYRKDIYTVETFLEIRRKVHPQVRLHQRIQEDIVTELQTPEKLRESLDVVDIALGLLSSGGGSPTVQLKEYIRPHGMARKPFSVKAKEDCTLGNILSLWETLSVELARQLWVHGQEPFEKVPNGYTEQLSDHQVTELNKCLRTFDLSLLLGILFEFIEVHVKHVSVDERDLGLVEGMDLYWDMTEQEPIDRQRFESDFPNDITVSQTVATWKHVADYKNETH